MTTLREAAKQALEALEGWKDDAPSQWSTNDEKLITALRAALAEEALQRLTDANQEIEAVLEQPEHGVTLKPVFYAPRRLSNEEVMAVIGPFRETEQEPVACPHRDEPRGCYRVRCQLGRKCVEPLYTHPPRREWRGLTDNEIINLVRGVLEKPANGSDTAVWQLADGIARAIEAALKERNV